MTEKTRLLKSAIDEIDRVLLGNKSPDVNEVYLNNAKRYIEESMADHQPTFEVGEYYVSRPGIIYLVTDVLSDHKAYSKALIDGKFSNLFIKTSGIIFKDSKPATAEEIAEFKRAEHFASKGRKLDDFKTDDICTFRGKVVLIQELDSAGDLWFYGNQFGEEYLSKEELKHLTLIQTAEELQEVADNAD